MALDARKDILWRIYLLYVFICIFGFAIVFRIVKLQFVEGDMWREKSKSLTTSYINIDASRGSIYSSDGSLLATSVPIYEIRMDVNADPLTDKVFNDNIDSLSIYLANMFKDKLASQYKIQIKKARKNGERYHFIKDNVRYSDLKAMRKFPMFRLGKYKGGLISIQKSRRELPFRELAARTIGYVREDVQPVGIEGSYDNQLTGVSGKRLMQKIAGGVWMPISNDIDVEPNDGCDIITTIDVNIQDVAEHALMSQLMKNNAGYGCVILMEVKTGQIKAIANLSRKDTNVYRENYNYAIGSAIEPGSTFKLASYIAAIEDGFIDIDDTVDIENGTHKFLDLVIKYSHEPAKRKITIKQAFEQSSNVAVAKVIYKYYSKNPQKFIDRLYTMNLNSPLGLEISGEGVPKIKKTSDKDWYGTTLPSMSRGYELLMTPLQILTFYNAVANGGKMVKPLFVNEVRKNGKPLKIYGTQVINPSICSEQTIEKVKKMMEGVVENGTAKNLKAASYKIAGKTGTAQIAVGGKYKNGDSKVVYNASFVGYFPAENPRYSCMVLVSAPSNGVFYGNVVAGPIFKEIADKVYSTSLDMHKSIEPDTSYKGVRTPFVKSGNRKDIESLASILGVKIITNYTANSEWIITNPDKNNVTLTSNKISERKVPNVIGMGLKDAIYILENSGVQVKVIGSGKIVKQSIAVGKPIDKGAVILLELA